MQVKVKLSGFVKDNCANFDRHYQTCIDDAPCKVLEGRRCGYFERCVLGPPDYRFRLPDCDYGKLFAQYAEQTGTESQTVEQRLCACGAPLRLRQRFCDDCTRKRRLKAKREYQRETRTVNAGTESFSDPQQVGENGRKSIFLAGG